MNIDIDFNNDQHYYYKSHVVAMSPTLPLTLWLVINEVSEGLNELNEESKGLNVDCITELKDVLR